MKRLIIGLVLAALSVTPCLGQVPPFPQTVPDHTVVGRIGIVGQPGPTQAIPFATLLPRLLPTPTRAGDVIYWNGTAWVTLAGNNSGAQCLSENASGVPSWAACSAGSGTPGGSNTQVQFNNGGVFGGSANLTWVSPALSIGVNSAGSVPTTGQLKLANAGNTGIVTVQAPSSATSWVLTLPTSAGSPNFCLQTDGGGITSWATCAAVTGAALTKTDDTNVTMSLSAGASTALVTATSLTLGWTGQLSGDRGGTGVANTGFTITLGGNLTTSGAFATTLTVTNTTNSTLPSGTHTLTTTDVQQTWTAVQNYAQGILKLLGPTSGALGLNCAAVCGSNTLTFPAGSTDFSATGPGVVQQASAGAAFSVGSVALSSLATQATNTVLGNATSGTAVPTALAVSSCSTASSALIWTTNSGFGCNTSITAATSAQATITNTSTNSTFFITFVPSSTTGSQALNMDSVLTFNPSTNLLSTTLLAATSNTTTPLLIGGSGTTGTQLTFRTTSGAGTTDQFAFTGGNAGGTTFGSWAAAGMQIVSTGSSAFAVGRLGQTTPAFNVDASTATSITGIQVKSAATTGGVDLAAVGETNVNLRVNAAGTGTIILGGTSTGAITLSRATTASVSLATPILGPVSDGTTALKITKADLSTAVMTFDTTNARVGINRNPSVTLDITGNVAVSNTSTGGGGQGINLFATQTVPHAGDNGDSVGSFNYTLTASSATNQLISRTFVYQINNQLTGGGTMGARLLDLISSTAAGAVTNAVDFVYIETGSTAGATNTSVGLHIQSMQGSTLHGIEDDITSSQWLHFGNTASTSTVTGAFLVSGGIGVAGRVVTGGGVQVPSVAFASLPVCSATTKGLLYQITDSNTVVFHATAAAGGANIVGVMCDGSAWKVGM